MEDHGGPPKVMRLPLDVSQRVKLSSGLCSLPQVVEELVCNSVDAEAKRVWPASSSSPPDAKYPMLTISSCVNRLKFH